MKRVFACLTLLAGMIYLLFYIHETTRWPVWGAIVAGVVAAVLVFVEESNNAILKAMRVIAGIAGLPGAVYLNYLSWNLYTSVLTHGYLESALVMLFVLRLIVLVGLGGMLLAGLRGRGRLQDLP